MSVLEELKKKISDIETQSLAMDGCRPTFTVSEIMDLIDSVESDKQKAESAQNVPNGDYISRQAAIDVVNRLIGDTKFCKVGTVSFQEGIIDGYCRMRSELLALPSAQPKQTASNYLLDLPTSPLLVHKIPSAQPDEKLRKIADLVEGSIDHFDRDDAMDLLYQIKEIVGNETSNIRG